MKHSPSCIQPASPTNKLNEKPCIEKQFQGGIKKMRVERISQEKQRELIKTILNAALMKRRVLTRARKVRKIQQNLENAFSTLNIS